MALSVGRGEAVASEATLGEVSPCDVKEFIELREVDGAGRVFCAGAADTGVAFIVNHSESC